MDPQTIYTKSDTPSMPYTNCETRIINLSQFEISDRATEEEYKSSYRAIVACKSPQSKLLNDAVNSVCFGIAPPVAFPTETVYGLGADATNRASIAGIFAAKGRPSDNPLIVHVASKQHLERLTGKPLPAIYGKLVEEHWPGPLTVLVPIPTNSVFAENVHPGQMTIGFRVPESKYARFFIAATDRPIAAPSANSSGKPSPTTAEHVMQDMHGKINFILDGGSCDVGVESTVVDGLCDPPLILRPGGVGLDELIAHGKKHGNSWERTGIGYKQVHHDGNEPAASVSAPDEAPRAPGMKYKHYAPHGKLIVCENRQTYGRLNSEIDHIIDSTLITKQSGLKTAINGTNPPIEPISLNIAILTSSTWSPFAGLALDTNPQNHIATKINGTTTSAHHNDTNLIVQKSSYRTHTIYSIDLGHTPKEIARSLFAALRTCDVLNCHYIFAEEPMKKVSIDAESDHQYDAVVERMRKAASQIL